MMPRLTSPGYSRKNHLPPECLRRLRCTHRKTPKGKIPMASPRIVARTSKVRALTSKQTKTLRHWLLVEKLTYAQAQARLFHQFGISLSSGTLSRFWNTQCQAAAPERQQHGPRVLLDVIIRSSRAVRVTVLESNARLRFKVGTQRRRGAEHKTFTINPPKSKNKI
jgi:hypothetical protein